MLQVDWCIEPELERLYVQLLKSVDDASTTGWFERASAIIMQYEFWMIPGRFFLSNISNFVLFLNQMECDKSTESDKSTVLFQTVHTSSSDSKYEQYEHEVCCPDVAISKNLTDVDDQDQEFHSQQQVIVVHFSLNSQLN